MVLAALVIVLLAAPLFAQAPDPARGAQRAQALVSAGRLEEAIRIYRDLVRDSPRKPVLLLNLSVAEYTAKRYREAAASAAAALKLQPDLLPARLFLGASELELGELPAAIDALKSVVAANPREREWALDVGPRPASDRQAGRGAGAAQDCGRNASEQHAASGTGSGGRTKAWADVGRKGRMGAIDGAAAVAGIAPACRRGPQCGAALA